MPKLEILKPIDGILRVVPNGPVQVEFTLRHLTQQVASASVGILMADNSEFNNPFPVAITGLEVFNGAWAASHSAPNILPADLNKSFRVTFQYPAENSVKFVRVTINEGGVIYQSSPVLISTITSINVDTKNAIQTSIMPTRVKVDARIKKINPGLVGVQVLVCNNAFDAAPTWEDMTVAFNNKTMYRFSNVNKTSANWGIKVRFILTKFDYIAGAELGEIYIAHV